jgi:alpha-L-fucosidase
LSADQRRALVLDVERGVTNGGEVQPWQTDTCIGSWHYEKSVFEQHKYKTARQVSQMLIDIVSKNGNLQLSIPLPGHGVPDADELKFLAELTAWMDVNSEGIHGTRPWRVYGEGPSVTAQAPRGQFGGARDVRPYTSEDVRFTKKGDALYAFIMVWPETRSAVIKSLALNSPHLDGRKVEHVALLGHWRKLAFTQTELGLNVTLPAEAPCASAVTLKIKGVLPA